MKLWNKWLSIVNQLEGAFSRKKTFFWFVTVLIGFTIKFDTMGVTSLARGVGLLPSYYTCMLHFFSSKAVDLEKLQRLWTSIVLNSFSGIVRINGRCVVIGDGIKVGKEGKKMPAVKRLHQSSESNSKAEYISGHSIQVVALLVQGLSTYFAVPLAGQIHEGLRYGDNDIRTLFDKLFEMLVGLHISESYYLVLDKYYCSGKFMKQLVSKGIDIVTMMKRSAVAYEKVTQPEFNKRGRPLKYGKKVKLFSLFNQEQLWETATIQSGVVIEYRCVELFWRPFGDLVLFVLTRHPTKGEAIVMSTDRTIDPISLITLYGLRFKIEVLFKQAVHQVGVFVYRFWVKSMASRKQRQQKEQNMKDFSTNLQWRIAKKMQAYHVFILCGLISQGLLQYLSIHYYESVWSNCGTWLRTIRQNTLPSEMITSLAMTQTYNYFLEDEQYMSVFKKFLRDKRTIKKNRYQTPSSAVAA